MTPKHRNQDSNLLERAVSALRSRTQDGHVRFAPEWYDLSADQREKLFRLQLESRILERAVDPEGLSTTARMVLRKCRSVSQHHR